MRTDKQHRADIAAARRADPDGRIAMRLVRKQRAARRARAIEREKHATANKANGCTCHSDCDMHSITCRIGLPNTQESVR